ncbi:MAG: N-acetyltransferase family protein [Hymenobacter sp.]
MELLPMTAAHWPAVCAIYEQGLATGNATFTTAAPTWEAWDASHLARCRLVAVATLGGPVLGWAALSPVSSRCVYGGVAEVSLYVATAARGQGVGRQLLAGLVTESEQNGLWTLQAGIFPENTASVRLHASGWLPPGRPARTHRPTARPLARYAAAGAPKHMGWPLAYPFAADASSSVSITAAPAAVAERSSPASTGA